MIHDTDTQCHCFVPSTVCQRIEAAVIYLSILQIIFHFQSRHFATRCWGLRQKVQGLKWNKCLLVAGLHNIKHHTPTPRCDWLWVCIKDQEGIWGLMSFGSIVFYQTETIAKWLADDFWINWLLRLSDLTPPSHSLSSAISLSHKISMSDWSHTKQVQLVLSV